MLAVRQEISAASVRRSLARSRGHLGPTKLPSDSLRVYTTDPGSAVVIGLHSTDVKALGAPDRQGGANFCSAFALRWLRWLAQPQSNSWSRRR